MKNSRRALTRKVIAAVGILLVAACGSDEGAVGSGTGEADQESQVSDISLGSRLCPAVERVLDSLDLPTECVHTAGFLSVIAERMSPEPGAVTYAQATCYETTAPHGAVAAVNATDFSQDGKVDFAGPNANWTWCFVNVSGDGPAASYESVRSELARAISSDANGRS